MSKEESRKFETQLETEIDKHGLVHILTLLSLICEEKASHVESDYQDKALAKLWKKSAFAIEAVTNNPSITALP